MRAIRVGGWDSACSYIYIFIAFRQSQKNIHCIIMCTKNVRGEGGMFGDYLCTFVFIVTEERLCHGQNNLTSRCAEAGGKSIQTTALKQVMSILS